MVNDMVLRSKHDDDLKFITDSCHIKRFQNRLTEQLFLSPEMSMVTVKSSSSSISM